MSRQDMRALLGSLSHVSACQSSARHEKDSRWRARFPCVCNPTVSTLRWRDVAMALGLHPTAFLVQRLVDRRTPRVLADRAQLGERRFVAGISVEILADPSCHGMAIKIRTRQFPSGGREVTQGRLVRRLP